MATLLQIVSDAVDELGNVARPTAVYSSSDRAIQRMLVLSNREGRDLARSADWTILQRTYSFATVNGTADYALPSDYSRLLNDTEWNRSTHEPIGGPLSPESWQALKSSTLGSGVAGMRYRIYRSTTTTARRIFIDPTPSTAETVVFDYISNQWCSDAAGATPASAWAADTDVSLLDSDLMTLGLIVRFKRAVGLEFASEADEYNTLLGQKKSQDRPAPTLSMVPRRGVRLLGPWNLPETGLTG